MIRHKSAASLLALVLLAVHHNASARFLSEDSVGFEAGPNFYVYVNNNPINANDPSGNCPNCVTAAGGAIIGGIAGGSAAYIKSGGDFNATLRGSGTGAAIGAFTGFTFGANVAATGGALALRGAATGFVSGAGGNAAGQFFGNEGMINVSESLVNGTFNMIPGAAQGALRGQALATGLYNNPVNTLGVLGLAGQLQVGGAAMSIGVSPAVPELNVDLSNSFKKVDGFLKNSTGNFNSAFTSGNSANGGFVLYPNKPNNNMLHTVYSK